MDDISYDAGHGRAYEKYGIDSGSGAVVVVRLDQRRMNLALFRPDFDTDPCAADVSLVGPLEQPAAMKEFFEKFANSMSHL